MPDRSPERFEATVTGTGFEEHKGFDNSVTKYKINEERHFYNSPIQAAETNLAKYECMLATNLFRMYLPFPV